MTFNLLCKRMSAAGLVSGALSFSTIEEYSVLDFPKTVPVAMFPELLVKPSYSRDT